MHESCCWEEREGEGAHPGTFLQQPKAGMPVLDSPSGTEIQLWSATSTLAVGHPSRLREVVLL